MATPIVYLPLLTTNLVGWAILGGAGYLIYKAGKKRGMADEEVSCTVKEGIKTAYKAKKQIDTSLSATKEKYAKIWNEAREEAVGE